MTETPGQIDTRLVDWATSIPIDRVPCVLAFLAARLLAAGNPTRDGELNGTRKYQPENLLTASQLAERLRVPESWVRTEERAGRIPGLRLGRYVRFEWWAVRQALAERKRQGR